MNSNRNVFLGYFESNSIFIFITNKMLSRSSLIKAGAASFAFGAVMEFTMIKTGFCKLVL